MRSNRTRAVAMDRKSHARALHARNSFCCTRGTRERAICGGGRSVGTAWALFGCCLNAAWMLPQCCLGAAW
eukprot:8795083-Lingulodinium_polyedra.AAC.1